MKPLIKSTLLLTNMKLKLIIMLTSIITLGGCSTAYQSSGFSGGYTETWLAERC